MPVSPRPVSSLEYWYEAICESQESLDVRVPVGEEMESWIQASANRGSQAPPRLTLIKTLKGPSKAFKSRFQDLTSPPNTKKQHV